MGLEEKLPAGVLLTSVEKLAGYARKSSVWPATFGLACCAIELMATGGPRHDLARFGMERASNTPRQADLMIVAGRVSQKMAPVLRQIYDQMSDPKWVISMGVCASSGGMFNNYAIVQGVDHIVPVDIYLPGCPPRPEMLIDAIVKLHDKIQNMKLGVNRERQITELEEARLRRLPLEPCGSSPCRPTRAGRRSLAADSRASRSRAACGDRANAGQGGARSGRRRPARTNGSAAAPDPAALAGQERLAERVRGPACSAPRPPATPPATAACRSAGRRSSPARGPYGSYFDELADSLATAEAGASASTTPSSGGGQQRRADDARAARAPARGGRQAAGRPVAGLRDVPWRVRRALPGRRRRGAARRLPAALDHAQPPAPARGDGA